MLITRASTATAAAMTMGFSFPHAWLAVLLAFFFIVLLALVCVCLCRRHLHLASARVTLPTFVFTGEEDYQADCSVCLSTVENGEVVRQLPACKHTFHVACIDRWLRAHSTCPICRTDTQNPH